MPTKKVIFFSKGHPLVASTHAMTLEFTKEDFLSKKGDCILGIESTLSASEIPEEIKKEMRKEGARIELKIECCGVRDTVRGHGLDCLTLTNTKSMVFRKSSYVDDRTVMICADKSAKDVKRELVAKARAGEKIKAELVVL